MRGEVFNVLGRVARLELGARHLSLAAEGAVRQGGGEVEAIEGRQRSLGPGLLLLRVRRSGVGLRVARLRLRLRIARLWFDIAGLRLRLRLLRRVALGRLIVIRLLRVGHAARLVWWWNGLRHGLDGRRRGWLGRLRVWRWSGCLVHDGKNKGGILIQRRVGIRGEEFGY